MLRESSFFIRTKIAADLVLLSAIIFISLSIFDQFQSVLTSAPILLLDISISLLVWLACARSFGLYSDLRMKPVSIEWVMFVKAFSIYTLLTSFIFFQIFKLYPFDRLQFLIESVLIFLMLPLQKLAVRIIFKKINNSHNYARKVLIVGAGKTGINFYENCVKNDYYGYQLAGFLDDMEQPSLNGSYLGKIYEIEAVMAKHELDDVVVALPAASEAQIQKIVRVAEQEGKRVRIIPDYDRFGGGRMQVDSLGSLSIITLRSLPLDYLDNKIYKRAVDLVVSSLLIVFVFTWLFPIIGLIIKLTSKGPIVFKQERWGLNNKTITCYKFRTMVKHSRDVDENGHYLQAQKNDPRVTKFGKFLRKTNLDELPQFFNVLFGSMSIVGPRPHPVPLNVASKDSVEKYMMRHWVKPGITGWAQVHGYRGETTDPFLMKKRVKYDLWYIDNWVFWLDLQIMVQTLVNMVKGEKNAY